MKYLNSGRGLLYLNVVSFILLLISLTVVVFLESQSRLVVELNVFGRKNRNYYLKKNAKEIKNSLYNKGKILVKCARTEKKYDLDFYVDRDANGTIYLIKNGSEIIIICTEADYMRSIDSERLINYYTKHSGYLNVRIEKASLCRKMVELLNDLLQDKIEGDIPTSGLIIYDEKLGLALFFCLNSWTSGVSSRNSLHRSLLLDEIAKS
ncbi:hypothetical protein THOM_1104 [Trachipleistophora hominis]|uniref:Uncharacterized protein n=1 Tax=Trachipleistophora hominis TaxID=72359 RepID=L7JYV5_TRAHO|nr:hypothetical protein THOM_1104 [Trachipleistophora hominis]